MKFGNNISTKRFLAQLLFLALPTVVIGAFFLWQANAYFSILSNQWVLQLLYFTSGLVLSLLFYIGRLRFLSTFIILIIFFTVTYNFLDNLAFGEFDSFFISKQFLVFSILFSFGWLCGWGLQRTRSFAIILASFFFLLGIYLISKTGEFSIQTVFFVLLPITFYGIYMIFCANEIHKSKETNFLSFRNLSKRLVFFLILLGFISAGLVAAMYDEIKEKIENYGGGESNEGNSMLNKNKDGSVSNQDKMPLKDNNNRSNELVFCAYIDNTFKDLDVPNPLYMTSFYFTQFDTLTETFERDKFMPFNDEFEPDPSQIPLFSIYQNKNKIDSGLSTKYRKEIEIEVYKKKLAPDAFLAPSTAFEVQSITVEKDYQAEFKYAYRAKSYVSELNSAYFIYNTDDVNILQFQEQRFGVLRQAASYDYTPKRFLDYYTFFPSSYKFTQFKSLADSLAKGKKNTIDKVLSIRDHFKQKNGLGEDVYSYSDNPGIPGLPGASKLTTFMFETKKGWCTYYAGSTLLLLRAMKIPSRIAVGFLTVDRSDNNKGWYWFYQDQAHAWVQVYFPEYGWLDFDFTIGNDEAQQSPTPDGTPPLQPPKPVLVVSGSLQEIDTLQKIITVQTKNILYNKKEFKSINKNLSIDVRKAQIWKDSSTISIASLNKNDEVMCVNYDPTLANFPSESVDGLIKALPRKIPMDEVYLKTKKKLKEETTEKNEAENIKDWKYYLLWSLATILLFVLFLFSLPYLNLQYMVWRYKRTKDLKRRSYRLFRLSTYYLHQLGFTRRPLSFYQFAKQVVEPTFQNDYARYANVYLKLKYDAAGLSPEESDFIRNYWTTFHLRTKAKYTRKQRFIKFLNLNKYVQYFYLPKIEEANG